MKHSRPFIFPESRILKPRELGGVYRTLLKAFGPQHWWPGETPFEVIVGAILTQNTAWSNVEKAIKNLKRAEKLSPRALRSLSKKQLAGLIRPAGYFNIKADRLKHFIQFLFEEYSGDVRKMSREKSGPLREKLLRVKGIGPETADSILLYACQKPIFVIDAYTKRIFSRHRLVDSSPLQGLKQGYDDWQEVFTRALWFETKPGRQKVALYNEYHAQIVYLGKHFCNTKPRCETCPLRPYL